MTPEEILRKVGLNGKILKEFALGKLLTMEEMLLIQHVILGDIEKYLRKKLNKKNTYRFNWRNSRTFTF